LFHAGSWTSIVVGIFLFADLQRKRGTVPKRLWAGALLGWGGFQVYGGCCRMRVATLVFWAT